MAVEESYAMGAFAYINVDYLPYDGRVFQNHSTVTALRGEKVLLLGDVGSATGLKFVDARPGEPNEATGLRDMWTERDADALLPGTGAAAAQLADGRIVVVTDTGAAASWTLLDRTGVVIAQARETGGTFVDVSGVNVAALAGGGFVVAAQVTVAAGEVGVRIDVYDDDGREAASFAVDASVAGDRKPGVAGLADGGFALCWHRDGAGGSEVWYAVYDGDGTVRVAPTALDTDGSINRNASVVALPDGGFAIAYEDNERAGNVDISLSRLDAAGMEVDRDDVTIDPGDASGPSLSVLGNGMLLVGFIQPSRYDISNQPVRPFLSYVAVVDPATGEVLAAESQTLSQYGDDADVTVAALGSRTWLTTYTDLADPYQADNEARQVLSTLIRVFTGDDADDRIEGDGMTDRIHGGGGNDTLRGGGDRDDLHGDGGDDVFVLAAGELGDWIHGGEGHDAVLVLDSVNLRRTFFEQVEELAFSDAADVPVAATLPAWQLDSAYLGSSFLFHGSANGVQDTLRIVLWGVVDLDLRALTFAAVEAVNGDRIVVVGDQDAESIAGTVQHDVLVGNGGADTLRGHDGDDVLRGGAGNDTLAGGRGSDWLVGDEGEDVFLFGVLRDSLPRDGDVLRDFAGNGTLPGDLVDLSRIDANALVAGDQEFTFIGRGPFTAAGQLRYANGILSANVDDDLAAEFRVELTGAPALALEDLIL